MIRLEKKSRFMRSCTVPKCPVCNMFWEEQINDGSTSILCSGCKTLWQVTN